MRSHASLGTALRIGTPGLTKLRKRGGMSMHAVMLPQNHTHKHMQTLGYKLSNYYQYKIV